MATSMEVDRYCGRCQRSIGIDEFSRRQRRSNVTKVHRECNCCFSSRQTTRLYEPVPAHPDVDLIATTCKYDELSHIMSVAFCDAATVDMQVYQHWAVDCSEKFITVLSTWEDHENSRELFKTLVEDVVRLEVEAGSGLYWEMRMWERSNDSAESDPWYNHPPFAEHGLPEDPANVLPEDHRVGNFDLNEAEDHANGLPEDHGVGIFDLNEAAEEINRDDNVELEVHAELNVTAIANILAKVNIGGDDESGEEEQAGADRQSYEVMILLTLAWKDAHARVGSSPNIRR
ncbi:hypothetical protein R1sor_001848 [Riccia sorocarpa]|uniref:Uncharacterized protein n=1 Tax=Riccia sorocarpa TaxID=122646 RepID=A0ABD3GYR3_9MARC